MENNKQCPICGSSLVQLKFKLEFSVVECRDCKHQFCPDASFDRSFESDLDEQNRLKALKNLRMQNFKSILNSIRRNSNASPKGLEVGSGHGWFLDTCKLDQIECVGIEPETCFNDLYSQNDHKVINGFFPEVIPYGSKYEFIAYNDVFEHLPDINTIMRVNKEYLTSDGLLIINLPVQEGLTYSISKLAYIFGIKSMLNRMWQFNFHSPHLHYFTKENLVALANKYDFRLVDSFPLKTINLSEVRDRVGEDKSANSVSRIISVFGVYLLYPFMQKFPDTFCFVFRKE